MSTTDAFRLSGPPADRIEAALLEAFAVNPPAATLRRLDGRMEQRLRSWHPSPAGARGRLVRAGGRPGRRAALVGLLAAAFVLAGANGSLKGLYLLVHGPFDTPWHRGQEINQSAVVDGYRVTVDRAYADATRLALAISVVDELERPGTSQVMAMGTRVSDAAGVYTSGGGAVSHPDGAHAAVNVVWLTPSELPLPTGVRQISVELPFIRIRDEAVPAANGAESEWPWHRVAGPWLFEFDVDVDGGTTIVPDVAAEANGLTVRVLRVIAASNVVRVEVRIESGGDGEASWPHAEIRHAGVDLNVVSGSLEEDGMFVLMTDGGVSDASGEWIVTVTEVDRGDGTLPGPWILRFDAP